MWSNNQRWSEKPEVGGSIPPLTTGGQHIMMGAAAQAEPIVTSTLRRARPLPEDRLGPCRASADGPSITNLPSSVRTMSSKAGEVRGPAVRLKHSFERIIDARPCSAMRCILVAPPANQAV